MKGFKTALVLTLMSLSINTISAQFGNNGFGGNNNRRNGGMGQQMGQMDQMNQSNNQSAPREIPVAETVSKIMEKLKPELNLDALQEIAIANVFSESITKQSAVLKSENSQEQKTNELKALNEITERNLTNFLNKEQKEKYKVLIEESKNPKKSRKKKK
jgi:hypothetical protein